MTGERAAVADLSFDDWVGSRVPALLRFAYLVTGTQQAAEDAVQSALARACERWSRVRRTRDPDAYVRQRARLGLAAQRSARADGRRGARHGHCRPRGERRHR